MAFDYDMVVIGGGAAGLVAAGMSAVLGAKTALVEQHRLGGDCTWTGCVPSKTLIRAARAVHDTRTADRFGLTAFVPQVPHASVMQHVREVRQHIYEEADAPPNLEKLGVELVQGRARFIDPHTVEIRNAAGTSRLTSRYFVIATGSRARRPSFEAPVLTNENLFELAELPKRLLIAGAGPIGIEMAQAFRRLGTEVTVVTPGQTILPRDDEELTGALLDVLRAEGITFCLSRKIVRAAKEGGDIKAEVDDGVTLRCDAILAAIGRQPNIEDLGLDQGKPDDRARAQGGRGGQVRWPLGPRL